MHQASLASFSFSSMSEYAKVRSPVFSEKIAQVLFCHCMVRGFWFFIREMVTMALLHSYTQVPDARD
jgi:hypothetical protein